MAQSHTTTDFGAQLNVLRGSPQDTRLDLLSDQFFNGFDEVAFDVHDARMFFDDPSPRGSYADDELRQSPNWMASASTKIQLDEPDGLHPQLLGYSADMDPYLLQHYHFDASGSFRFKQLTIQSASLGSAPTQFLLSQPEQFSFSRQEMGLSEHSHSLQREELETFVSADTGARLISLFCRFILPQYPIFSDSALPSPRGSPPHLLAALYMVAQPFARFDDALSIELAYEGLNTQALFKFITQALLYESHDPDMSTVQTLVLLVLRPSSNPLILESSVKWSLHGQLVSVSHTLGLHYDPSAWTIAPWKIALRRRLSTTIFTLDKWLACSLGRPPLIGRAAWLVTSVTNADGHESGLDLLTWSRHICTVQLGSLLGDVLENLYALRAVANMANDINATLDISRRLLEELSSWYEQYQLLSPAESAETTSLFTVFILGYHYVKMTIFRAIIRPAVSNHYSSSDTIGTTNQSSNQSEIRGFARLGVRSSTSAAADFVTNLKEEHVHMFWPHWSQIAFSSICFLDLLMAVSSLSTEEAVDWFGHLHMVRKQMRFKANMLPVLRLGLLRIDAIYWKGVEKVIHLPPHVRDALQMSTAAHAT
ncbi:fungal-specific transcription factor domain-containing protein [Phaeosphaeria sp. MPI-PUGE-AT-0046c]|nr:fungal-specific transcription factor domain-containing protein [Phaeosphaeria sp. MPI-PUGE-AT-0046c]